MKRIMICMGSSCFARENRNNLRLIEEFLKSHSLTDSVELVGSLCLGKCGQGPNLKIDDIDYHNVTEEELNSILHKELISYG